MANSTEYRVRVVFQTVLGNLEGSARRAVADIRQIGTAGRNAGREGSAGLERITEAAEDSQEQLQRTETAATRFSSTLKTALKAAVVGYAGKKITEFGVAAVTEFGKTQKALGEVASLGIKDLDTLEEAAMKFSNTWSGTTREDFISAAYDIKSGISTLSDEGVAKFTSLAGLTAKATKATTSDMTSLFATGYGIYRKFYDSDDDFGQAFSAGIAKSVQQFKTDGVQMAGAIESLGASASSANVPLEEQLSVLGMLQATMGGAESGTKYRAFLQSAARAGKALNLQFLDANNQLKSMPDILEQIRSKYGDTIDANEKIELTKAFGTEEAVALIDLLYGKTGDLKNNIDAVGESIAGGTKSVEDMADHMNNGPLEKMELIKQAWGNVLSVMGKQIAPGVMPAMDSLHDTLIELQESGDFTALGEAIGKLVQAGAALFTSLLDKAPEAISALADAMQWLVDNLDLVTGALKIAAIAWAGFKAAAVITKVFGAIGSAISKVVALFRQGSGAIAILKAALKTGLKSNLLGLIISLVISLVSWFFKVTKGVDGFKNKFVYAMNSIRIAFLKLISGITKKWAGFVSFFSKSLAESANNAVKKINDEIAKIEKANSKIKGDKDKGKNKKEDKSKKEDSSNENVNTESNQEPYKEPESSGAGYTGGGGTATPKTIQDRIGDIEDRYTVNVDNAEIKADLAEGENKTSEAKSFKQMAIEYLKKQATDLLHLEGTQSGNNKTIVENARLNTLKKIQELTSDIKDGVNKMAGDFNTPSDITAMNKYQYVTSKGSESGLYYSNGKVDMYFNIKNPDGLSTEQLKNYINEWAITGAITAGGLGYDEAKRLKDQSQRY